MGMLGDATPPVFLWIRSQDSRGAKPPGRIIFLELWERNSALVLVPKCRRSVFNLAGLACWG